MIILRCVKPDPRNARVTSSNGVKVAGLVIPRGAFGPILPYNTIIRPSIAKRNETTNNNNRNNMNESSYDNDDNKTTPKLLSRTR